MILPAKINAGVTSRLLLTTYVKDETSRTHIPWLKSLSIQHVWLNVFTSNLCPMFTDTMTGEELYNEYLADVAELQSKTFQFDRSKRMEAYLQKNRKRSHIVTTRMFQTDRNNRYIGTFIYNRIGTRGNRDWSLSANHIGLLNTTRGIFAIAFYEENMQALKLTPHFFNRYKERFGNIADWQIKPMLRCTTSLVDVASIFFRRNPSISWIETDTVFYDKVHIFAAVNDGVALMQWDNDKHVLQANTFVTNDMLSEKQSKLVDYAKLYQSMTPEERKNYNQPEYMFN